MEQPMRMPLEGIRVLDVTIWIQGPLASMMLADLGAEVIKVEKPGQGDFARGVRAMFGQPQVLADGRSLMFEIANRNKKAVGIDLRTSEGQEVFYRLVQQSDVVVTNLHPATLREFRIDRETLLALKPDLIYAHATGFGPHGPHAEDPCQDTVGMARSGFMFNTPTADGSPTYPMGALSDILSGTMLGFGVLAALLGRERTGVSQAVWSSQLSAMMWLQYYNVAQVANMGADFASFDRTTVANPLMNLYRCADGQWIACGMAVAQRFWPDFCAVMGLSALEHEARFATDKQRAAHRTELVAILDTAFAMQPRAHWEQLFREKKFWFSVVNRISDLPADPQVMANHYLTELDSGIKTVGFPFALEKTSVPKTHGAPNFSQHTDEILQYVGGYTPEEILALKEKTIAW
ncbi:MAG: CaiB/BaiF CoA transferase family protein [Candidatus Binatia bacterium]